MFTSTVFHPQETKDDSELINVGGYPFIQIKEKPVTYMKKGDMTIEVVDPTKLSSHDYKELHEVTQDMWARGMGEFMECKDCQHIESKKDIFGDGKLGITQERYKKSIRELMEHTGFHGSSCPHCSRSMEFVYGPEYIHDIKSRLLETESYIALCKFRDKIVGYMDFYLTTVEDTYNREWKRHYEKIGFSEVEKRIVRTLGGKFPQKFFSFSSMGLLEEYSTFFTTFQLLRLSLNGVPDKSLGFPGGTELDKNNCLYRIYAIIGSKSIGINTDNTFKSKIVNSQPYYDSDLVVFDTPVETFRKHFSMEIKDFLRKYGAGLKTH